MAMPLMPKATAVWLVENTSLTFEQIGEFIGVGAVKNFLQLQEKLFASQLTAE